MEGFRDKVELSEVTVHFKLENGPYIHIENSHAIGTKRILMNQYSRP